MKKIVLGLLLIFMFTFIHPVNISAMEFSNYEYYIDSYNVEIKVNENNSLDIVEDINAVLLEMFH